MDHDKNAKKGYLSGIARIPFTQSVRDAVRWSIRKRLYLGLLRARGEEIKQANAALNVREFWQKRARLQSFPVQLQIGSNWTCNLRCVICRLPLHSTREYLRTKPALELSPRALENALNLMPYASVTTVTPLGEPLLYSRFGHILERHRTAGCKNLVMTTNANLINDTRARQLVEGGMQRIVLSIDAASPAAYRDIRQGGSLEAVEAAIEALNRWKDRLNSDTPALIINATFLERNVREMPSLVDFALRHRIAEYRIQQMEVENPELEPEYLGHHLELAQSMVLETLKRAEEAGVKAKVHLGLANLLAEHHTDSREVSAGRTTTETNEGAASMLRQISARGRPLAERCPKPMGFLFIDTDGDCRPCSCAGVSLGNINEASYEEIWNCPPAVQIRRDFHRNHLPLACQGRLCRIELGHTGVREGQ